MRGIERTLQCIGEGWVERSDMKPIACVVLLDECRKCFDECRKCSTHLRATLEMTDRKKKGPDWRGFEQLVARIEEDSAPLGLKVTSPDRIPCRTTGRLREVDASIRSRVGTANVLITVECRKRGRKQDVTWIEQLAAKKHAIGADRTIAVSSAGFSLNAQATARKHGIDVRRLSDLSIAEINHLLRLDFVLFTHKKCALASVGIRTFRSLQWTVPDPNHVDFTLSSKTDPFSPIFCNTETGHRSSLNDLWLQLQEATDPFAGVIKGEPPKIRTACFPYPGNVIVDTPNGPTKIGDVLLSLAVWLDVETVELDAAKKVEYGSSGGPAIQRVEFSSRDPAAKDWRVSLQIPKDSADVRQLRTGGSWPKESP
jgi:hypothetical protein